MNKEVFAFLTNTFLFKGLCEEEITRLVEASTLEHRVYAKGELIYSPTDFKRKIGFIMSGVCRVLHERGESAGVIINRLPEGASFGVLPVFSDGKDFPTSVVAYKRCEIIFISADAVFKLIDKSSVVAVNVIRFLANRVGFLNERIATYSGATATEKLASHLLSEVHRLGTLEIPLNKKRASEEIGCGRATLYRALLELSERGLVTESEKNIIINDREGLERISK